MSRATTSTILLRDASNSMDVLRRRYASSKHSSVTTTTSTSNPLTDSDLSDHELVCNTTPTAGMTSFLPTLHSTPPMPTFQKPGMHPRESPSPTKNITHRPLTRDNINATFPPHPKSETTMSTFSKADDRTTDPKPPVFQRRRDANNIGENAPPPRIYIPHRSPETIDGTWPTPGASNSRVSYYRNSQAYTTTPFIDRVTDTPPLPAGWNEYFDRLICKIDALGYDHTRIVQEVRQLYPHVRGVLTPAMVDKRLRQLDQNIEIDYWRAGMQSKDTSEVQARKNPRDSQDRRSARQGGCTNTPQSQPNTLQQQQGEQRHQHWTSQYGSLSRGRDDPHSPGVRRNDSASGR